MNEELRVVVTAEIGDLKSALSEGKKEVQDFADSNSKLQEVGDGFQKVGDFAKKGLAVVGTAVAGAAASLLALSASTAEYRTAQAKLVSAFETAGGSAETAKQTYNDLYRVLGDGDVAVEASNHLAQLTTSQKDLSEWTDICQGVYATFGDSIPIEGLTEAANETAKTGALTGSLADALNWAGVNEEEFQAKLDACVSTQEREALIRETLSGLYSEAAASYEENAASLLAQNEANAKLEESMAKVGEAIEPVKTALTELAADVLAQLAPYIEEFAANHLPKIVEALGNVGTKIGEVISWIADHWELVSTIGTVVAAIAVAIATVSTALGVYNTVMAITTTVSLPVIGIIAAIVAGIALLVAGIVLAVKHWDDITAAIKKFAESVGEFFSGLWDSITEWISNVGDSISQWWEDTKQGFSDWWDGIAEGWTEFWSNVGDKIQDGVNGVKEKFNTMKENVSTTVNSFKDNVKNKFEEIKTGMSEKIQQAKETVKTKFSEIKNTMGTIMQEAKETVQERLNNIKQAYEENGGGIKGIVAATTTFFKDDFKAAYDFLDKITNGKFGEVVNTIKNKLNEAKNKVTEILNNIKNKFSEIWDKCVSAVKGAIDKLKGLMNFKWELPKLKLPHFSISGKFSLDPPSIPKISVKWYAQGGVFDNPTLFKYGNNIGGLGEQGAEAIVPLEKNTQWLDRIAERLMAKQGNTPIVLQVDGKTFAQTTIHSINELTKQTGSLALNIV